jgi:hypothetical protein
MEYDKHFAIPSCVNALVWTINICWRDINFVKMITQRILLTPMYHECLCIPARVLGQLYKEILPPNAEILSLAET